MKFVSKYTNLECQISAAQYLAEQVCERMAAKNKVTLPVKFWNTTEWKKTFLFQLRLANSLLKIYHVTAIIAALRQCPFAYSLNYPGLNKHAKIKQEELLQNGYLDKFGDAIPIVQKEVAAQPVEIVKPKPAFKEIKKSSLDKLRELE